MPFAEATPPQSSWLTGEDEGRDGTRSLVFHFIKELQRCRFCGASSGRLLLGEAVLLQRALWDKQPLAAAFGSSGAAVSGE